MNHDMEVKVKMCLSKRGYLFEHKAKRASDSVVRNGGPRMRVYKCPHCPLFHLTKEKELMSKKSKKAAKKVVDNRPSRAHTPVIASFLPEKFK